MQHTHIKLHPCSTHTSYCIHAAHTYHVTYMWIHIMLPPCSSHIPSCIYAAHTHHAASMQLTHTTLPPCSTHIPRCPHAAHTYHAVAYSSHIPHCIIPLTHTNCIRAAHTVPCCTYAAHTYDTASMQYTQHYAAIMQHTEYTLPPCTSHTSFCLHAAHTTLQHTARTYRAASTPLIQNRASSHSHTTPHCIHTAQKFEGVLIALHLLGLLLIHPAPSPTGI